MGVIAVIGVLYVALVFLMIAAGWKINTKAGQPGWAVLVPIYNIIVMLRIIRKPWWWLILMCIPLVNIVFAILYVVELSKAFGKGTGFAVGLILLSPIFYLILAFGDAQYVYGSDAPVNAGGALDEGMMKS